ncbi:MAG: DUF3467 domain-containing protein [Deltaproteobacteria bacterium]|nr:DUF3467 domain-containing protein [Deltaproteobacteria bacterium]
MPQNPQNPQNPQKPPVPIKVREEVVGGVYSNNMVVAHTREEFVMDFIYLFPQQGIVNARVITSPGHMKRIIRALNENMRKYEAQFGEIKESSAEPTERVVN